MSAAAALSFDDTTMDAATRAVAEPTRRAILRLIHDDEQSVTEISGHFPVSRPAISQHLKVLHDADLVTIRRSGTHRFYRARPEGLAELRQWIESFWTTKLDELKRVVESDHPRRD